MVTSQTEFRAALFDPSLKVPPSLTDGQARPAGKRFDVYRNNVVMSLTEAMAESFPVVQKLIGAQNFASLSGLYLRAHPPSDPRMMLYGAEFPAFLSVFAPLAHLGYLPDVARLELAQRHSYHAADSIPMDPSLFASTAPDELARAQLHFAPSLKLIRSDWPILDIWHFNMTEGAPQPQTHAQDVMITRPEFDPLMHALPLGGADLIEALAKGSALGKALEITERAHPDFDFPGLLGLLLQQGALIEMSAADHAEGH